MDWSPALPAWNPSQLPGLVTNRTILSSGPPQTDPIQSPSLVFDPSAAKLSLIEQTNISNPERRAILVSAAHAPRIDENVKAALNICMEEIISIAEKSDISSLSSMVSSLLESPTAAGTIWLRLLVALCVSSSQEGSFAPSSPHSLTELIKHWIHKSPYSAAPIAVLAIHIHRHVIPDLIHVLRDQISSASQVSLSKEALLLMDILEYIAPTRPASFVPVVEKILEQILSQIKTQVDSTISVMIIGTLLQKKAIFQAVAPATISRAFQLLSAEPHLENLIKTWIGVHIERSPTFPAVLLALKSVAISHCTLLPGDSLGKLVALLQTFNSWVLPAMSNESGTASTLEALLGALYNRLLQIVAQSEDRPAEATSFAALLRQVLEDGDVERSLSPDVFNTLFRWMSLASSAGEPHESHPQTLLKQSDSFRSMTTSIFKSSYPAFYVDQGVLEQLDKIRTTLSAQESLTVFKNLVLHLQEDVEASGREILPLVSRELKRNVPLRLLLNAVELEAPTLSVSTQLLQVSSSILRQCVPVSAPMNVYLFLQASLENLLAILMSRSHPTPIRDEENDSIAIQKVEWLQHAIIFIAGQNMHLHNVAVAFAVKHLCSAEAVATTLHKKHSRKHDFVGHHTHGVSDDASDPPAKKQSSTHLKLHHEADNNKPHLLSPVGEHIKMKELSEASQTCLLQLILGCLRIGDRDQGERLAVVTEQFLLRVVPPLPAPTNEQYAEILPRKPTFDRDVAIERLLMKSQAIMSLLQMISSVPMELVRCIDAVKSILAITIGNWNHQASSVAVLTSPTPQTKHANFIAPAVLLATTRQLWTALSAAQWLPPMLQDTSDLFSVCQPHEAVQLLMSAWNFIKECPPVQGVYFPAPQAEASSTKYERLFNGDTHKHHSQIVLHLLRKYVHKVPGVLLQKIRLLQK